MRRENELFESETLNSYAFIKKQKLNKIWLTVFFLSLILCGNGRSISLIMYLGGSLTIIIIVYIIGFIALIAYLDGLFSRIKGAGNSVSIDDGCIKIGSDIIPLESSVKIKLSKSPTFNEVDLEKLGNNWIEYCVGDKTFKVEFFLKSKKHKKLLEKNLKQLSNKMSITLV